PSRYGIACAAAYDHRQSIIDLALHDPPGGFPCGCVCRLKTSGSYGSGVFAGAGRSGLPTSLPSTGPSDEPTGVPDFSNTGLDGASSVLTLVSVMAASCEDTGPACSVMRTHSSSVR